MAIGIGNPIYDLANLPGQGGGGGAVAPTVDLIDNAYSFKFDGTGSYFQVPKEDVPAINNIANMSYSIWIRPDSTSDTTTRRILSQFQANGNKIEMIVNSNTLTFNLSTGNVVSTNGITFTQASPDWANVVMAFDGALSTAERVKIYVNGSPQSFSPSATNPALTPNIGPTAGSSSRALNIGAFQASEGATESNEYAGYVDELAFFNRTLTEEEAKLIYDSTNDNPGKTAKLDTLSTGAPIAWYRMGD
jgi:hypothetical protein